MGLPAPLTLYLGIDTRLISGGREVQTRRRIVRIGEVATDAGVGVQTLRYYERRGLIPRPSRRPSGYRDYPGEVVARVRFVKRAQDLGFTLAEIRDLLALRDDPAGSCDDVRAAAAIKLHAIDAKLRSLGAMREALAVLVRACDEGDEPRPCPLIEALDEALAAPIDVPAG